MTQGNVRVGIALLTLVLSVPALALASEPASDRISSPRVTVVDGSLNQAPALPAGMIVAIDPDTGERRAATADEAASLTAASRFQAKHPEGADLHQFTVRNGGTGLLLDSRYMISERVEMRLDGTLSISHEQDATDWIGVLQPALTAPRPAGDEAGTVTTSGVEVQP